MIEWTASWVKVDLVDVKIANVVKQRLILSNALILTYS